MMDYIIRRPKDTFEEVCEFLCECLENGYDYGLCVHEVSMRHNLDNTRTAKVRQLMDAYEWDKDPEYTEFCKSLRSIM